MKNNISYRVVESSVGEKRIYLQGTLYIESNNSYNYELFKRLSNVYTPPSVHSFTTTSLIFNPKMKDKEELDSQLNEIFSRLNVLHINRNTILEEQTRGLFYAKALLPYTKIVITILKELVKESKELQVLKLLEALLPFKMIGELN